MFYVLKLLNYRICGLSQLLSLPSEVGWNLAPFLGFPLEDRDGDIVGAKPILGTGDNLVELFGLWSALQLGLALFLGQPELGIHAITVDGLVGDASLCHQGKGMDDGKKLADIVGAVDRTIVENLCASLKVDALVFHRTGVSRTSGIHCPGISIYLVGQR